MLRVELLKNNKLILFMVVYMLFLLDNILLTVVVPIIPDYLFSSVLNYTAEDSSLRYGPASLSPLQRKYETLENDNGPLGALLASKAFVQLAFTPLVGYLTQVVDTTITLLVGSCNMFIAAIRFGVFRSLILVPIIPDYLFSSVLNYTAEDSSLRYGPASLSPLQRKYETLENDNGPLGALLASKAFVQLAFTPLVGYLTQVVDTTITLLVGSCNMFIAAILFAYGNSYGFLVLARALHGSSSAAIAVSGMCILAQNVPKDSRNRLMPLAFGGIALGVLIGYPLGGAAYQLFGKRAPFLFIAFFILIAIVLQLIRTPIANLTNIQIRSYNIDDTFNQWITLFKDKVTLISGLAICICTSSMAILEPCVPMWLLIHMKPRPTKWQLGAVFIPDSLGYFIGSHFAGLLSIQPWRISISAMVLAGLCCCFLPIANSMTQLGIPHFGLGLGVGAVDASLVPFLANFVDKKGGSQYGPIYAFQQAAVAIAYSCGPLLGGQAVEIFGFPWLMRMVGFMNLLFCPLLLELENQSERANPILATGGSPTYSALNSVENHSDESHYCK